MTIESSDIKLLGSQRMTDTTDGGGRITNTEVPDNEPGNLFPKISRLDSVYGRVNLRKIALAVKTATLDTYAGANLAVIDPPGNPDVNVLLFSTGSEFDERRDARNRIESYVVKGVTSRMRLFGDQIVGQKAILVYQRTDEQLPEVGEVYLLSVEGSGHTPAEQYFRITDIDHEVRTFTVTEGNQTVTFDRRVITLGIGYPLKQTFPGLEVSFIDDKDQPTVVRETTVADAAKYYGVRPIDGSFPAGSFSIKADSLFSALVPAATRESPISAQGPSDAALSIESSGVMSTGFLELRKGDKTFFKSAAYSVEDWGNTDGMIKRGETGEYMSLSEDGLFATVVGNKAGGARLDLVYGPNIDHPSHTDLIEITLATQGTVYSQPLAPIPAPGTLAVDYRAQGRWYRIKDNGQGEILDADGNPSLGSGSISYQDGSMVVTLGALPDVGSAVMLSWGSKVHYLRLEDLPQDPTQPEYRTTIPGPVAAGTLTITSSAGTSTDDGAGAITGAETGVIDYATGEIRLNPPAPGDILTIESSRVETTVTGGSESVSATASGETLTATLSAPPQAGTVRTSVYVGGQTIEVRDNGAGVLWRGRTRVEVGSINYATGAITIDGLTVDEDVYVDDAVAPNFGSWGTTTHTPDSQTIEVYYAKETDTTVANANITTDPIESLAVDLTYTTANPVVEGSVIISTLGRDYYDRAGTLYSEFSAETGAGTPSGSINYATGRITITEWDAGESPTVTVRAGLVKRGDWTATALSWRTPGSPLRPASLYIQATTADGRLISGTADQSGNITGTEMRGIINTEMGVVNVEFGQDPGTGWEPTSVLPGTVSYSAVILSSLPLDPKLLGLDPVRLPKDGRVPIYRPGDVVVLHNTQDDSLPEPLSAGATYTLSRDDLAVCTLIDANGNRLSDTLYTVDLAAGVVEMSAVLDLSNYDYPIIARHRREEMSLIGGTQIDGTIELSSATQYAHDQNSYVSSALLFGDMQARVTGIFDQATWTGEWGDELIGDESPANYDDLNYPIEVINSGAVTERWRINFTSSTEFQIVGENLGIIATGDTSTDLQPVNPLTNEAYFTLRADGWGLGWSAGNQLRFNTEGAVAPVWISRTVLAGADVTGDSFSIERRGDVD